MDILIGVSDEEIVSPIQSLSDPEYYEIVPSLSIVEDGFSANEVFLSANDGNGKQIVFLQFVFELLYRQGRAPLFLSFLHTFMLHCLHCSLFELTAQPILLSSFCFPAALNIQTKQTLA